MFFQILTCNLLNHCFSYDGDSTLDCFEMNIDFTGNDLVRNGIEGIASAELCRDECLEKASCKFFTYIKRHNECWVKTSDAGRKIAEGAVSGKVNCPNPSTLNGNSNW